MHRLGITIKKVDNDLDKLKESSFENFNVGNNLGNFG